MLHSSKKSIDWISKIPKEVPDVGHAASRYGKLVGERAIYLDAAYRNAKLTLPNLIRESKNANNVALYPWTGVGAEGVGSLASNFNLSLYPSGGISFFSLMPDKVAVDNIVAMFKDQGLDGDGFRNKLEAAAAALERKIMHIYDNLSIRSNMHKAFEHLIVCGNVLMHIGHKESLLYPMDRYVVRRSASGKVLEILIQEQYYRDELPKQFMQNHFMNSPGDERDSFERNIEVTTRVHYDHESGMCFWWQEAFKKLIPESQSSCPIKASPWLAMRYNANNDSPYSEGLVSQIFGTLVRLDNTTNSTAVGFAASQKMLYLVDPSSMITPQMLRDTKRMDVLPGRADEVSILQGGKTSDLAASKTYEDSLKQELQLRFAMPSALQRNKDRVTATEIQILSNQLESISTGFYSLYATEVQIPLVNRLLHIGKSKGLPTLDEVEQFQDEDGNPLVEIKPITGLNALQRNNDLQKLMEMVQILQNLPQDVLPRHLNMSELLQRIATALGVNTGNLIYTAEQIAEREAAAAEAEQQQQQQLMAQQQQQQEMKMAGEAMNSSVLTEFIKRGDITPQDLDTIASAQPDNLSNTAAQVRPGI